MHMPIFKFCGVYAGFSQGLAAQMALLVPQCFYFEVYAIDEIETCWCPLLSYSDRVFSRQVGRIYVVESTR